MRRAAWIFLASILLPSLGLAWLAIRSVQDQQVVLEHQQVIISQNITDALAKNIQAQMDQVRADFVTTTQQLLGESSSPRALAEKFDQRLRESWPMADIGFAVNIDGEVSSPKPYDSPEAKIFRDENDRFLSNRENAEVYSLNASLMAQNFLPAQKATLSYQFKVPAQAMAAAAKQAPYSGYAMDSLTSDKDQSAMPAVTQDEPAKLRSATENNTVTRSSSGEGHSVPTTSSPAAASSPNVDLAKAAPASLQDEQGKNRDALAGKLAGLMQTRSKLTGKTSSIAISSGLTKGEIDLINAPAEVPQASNADLRSASDVTTTTVSTAPPPPMTCASDSIEPAATTITVAPAAPAGMPEADSGNTVPLSPPAPVPTSNLESAPGSGELSEAVVSKAQRNVIPQKMLANQSASVSNTVPEESDFRRIVGSETSGELARFLEDKLHLLVWARPAAANSIIFGAQLDQSKLIETLKISFQIPELTPDGSLPSGKSDFCVAILDDTGHPVALSHPGFVADWKRPFVATEIGEVLPHWEAALYLVDPDQIGHAARTLQTTLALIVLLLVAAIVSGGSLIAADVRRQVRLAQQKTDFVSNVSHELKTPLTSIRMFADLLAEKRVPDEERQATYLRIIAAEASRLTRLINNVLDFARLERGAPPGEHRPCDLVDAVRDVAETCGPHLEAAGISFTLEVEAESLPIRGDRDALAQIILNLVSNAEKYGGRDVLVRVRRQETPGAALGCVDVLDRGPGIPPRQEKTIFEPFHRLDDSLSSGIPGSGLGLTLARRMARSHGGDVTYSSRAGGGSCFTLTIPLEKS